MKKLTLLIPLILSSITYAQTSTTINGPQIACRPFPVPQVLVTVPPGNGTRTSIICALVDTTTLTLDTTTVPPTLRANPPVGPINVDGETPVGVIDGINVSFTLVNIPNPITSLHLYRNGLRQSPGIDFTITGNTITFLVVATPQVTDLLKADYRH